MSVTPEQLTHIAATLRTRKDWYKDPEFIRLYNQYFQERGGSETATQTEEQWEVIRWFAALLAQNIVLLTNTVQQGCNDDDRAGKYAGSENAALVVTVVVHHTTTTETVTIWELEAISLLRLYLPHFINGMESAFIRFLVLAHEKSYPEFANTPLAPASGHFMIRHSEEGFAERVHTFVAIII